MNQDDKLRTLFQEQFEAFMERFPITATFFGYKHEIYDHLLPKGSSEANEETIVLLFRFKEQLKSIDYEALSEERKLDFELLNYFFDSQIFTLNELATWRSGVSGGGAGPVGTIGTAIFPLYTRNYASLEKRVKAIINRLEAVPKFLKETKSTWQFPVKLWTEMALEEGPRTIGFLQLIQNTLKPNLDPNLHEELLEAIEIASKSINNYGEWIKNEILPATTHEWLIGSQKFARLMDLRKLGKGPAEILKIGENALEDTKNELKKLGREIDRNKTVEEIREIIKNDHPPTFEMVLEHVRELTQNARQFILEKNLMILPEEEELQVLPTPSFLVPVIPFAAYIQPEKFSKVQIGQYIVTPLEGRYEMLKEHSYASCKNVAVHEGYPGHHLQLTSANLQPELIRSIVTGEESVEGWAHYCEQLMAEEGFLGKNERFMQLIDQLWRAVRIIVDIKLHTGQMTIEEAKEFMMNEVGMDENAVTAELKWYTLSPGYPLSYLLGKLMILELRDYVKQKMSANYTDEFFHNTILNSGGMPIFFLKKFFDLRIAKTLNTS
ncbi:MAG: DUF885 domain-containing protein [Candidatus Hermodarchaeota archaeon]